MDEKEFREARDIFLTIRELPETEAIMILNCELKAARQQAREDAIQDIESVKNEYFNHLLNREGFDRTEKEIGIVEGIDKCLAKLKELKNQGDKNG